MSLRSGLPALAAALLFGASKPLAIIAGGLLLSWEPGAAGFSKGTPFILVACLCWAIDNNLTRKVSTNDAMLVAGLKGLVAGACNTALALAGGASWPALPDGRRQPARRLLRLRP